MVDLINFLSFHDQSQESTSIYFQCDPFYLLLIAPPPTTYRRAVQKGGAKMSPHLRVSTIMLVSVSLCMTH